jgi:NarL family two-component system response regulator LiaR
VLALLVQGLTNPAIAARLVVSRATVKAHVSSILAKLGASTRAEAIRLALQHQLVP